MTLAHSSQSPTTNSEPLQHQGNGSPSLQVGDGTAEPALVDDVGLEELRAILLDHYRRQVDDLQGDLDRVRNLIDELETQISDQDALVTTIKPVIAEAIAASIYESRDAMVDALYPIMGRLVTRAVTEAMRDLARSIDNQMRNTFNLESLMRRLRARTTGVPESALILRSAMPFTIEDLFLIHRETGLPLAYVAEGSQRNEDSEVIGSMLTAIRDFAQDAFGRGQEGQLDGVQYGDKRILIEAGQTAYVAVVMLGVEPSGVRAEIRELLVLIEQQYYQDLRHYEGDSSVLSSVESQLREFLNSANLHASKQANALIIAPESKTAALPANLMLLVGLGVVTLVLLIWRLGHLVIW